MYAERTTRQINPGSLAAAVGLNGAVIAALIFAAPEVFEVPPPPPFSAYNVPRTPPPPPEPRPLPKAEAKPTQPPRSRPDSPEVDVIVPRTADVLTGPADPGPLTPPDAPIGTGSGGTIPADPPRPRPLPVLVGAVADPRAVFQPPYPPDLRRSEIEGRVTVRVLIGADGRVQAVEPVGEGEPGFFEATRRHALARWRFRPATRDGEPYAVWKLISVRFELQD